MKILPSIRSIDKSLRSLSARHRVSSAFGSAGLLGAASLLSACAPPEPPTIYTPPPPLPVVKAVRVAPAITPPPYPVAPANHVGDQKLPPRDAQGRFITLNSGVRGERAFWHMRIGLNVAAIGCRGTMESSLVGNYNRFITKHGRLIRSNDRFIRQDIRQTAPKQATAERDRLSTQLFNYFAQPPAQKEFCKRAEMIAQLVANKPTQDLIAQASEYLVVLDQPFIDFYEAYSSYRSALEDWEAYKAYYEAYHKRYNSRAKLD